jgi:23S rRNA (cytosine1962-C5)-methyltransferase
MLSICLIRLNDLAKILSGRYYNLMDLYVKSHRGYELLDSGDGRKLERFGNIVLNRPSPQAIWPRVDSRLWSGAHFSFFRTSTGKGEWKTEQKTVQNRESWVADMGGLKFEFRLTGFGNIGFFAEHTCHWNKIKKVLGSVSFKPEILNLFAYTGAISLVCAKAGANVTHVDSAKAVNGWAMRNADLNRPLRGTIRYLAEDAFKFVKKETKRGKKYDAVILDPPTFGRGTKGEVWKIEADFYPLIEQCRALLSDRALFMLVTSHSPGITPTVVKNLISVEKGILSAGEMIIRGSGNCSALPLGVYALNNYYKE